MKWLLCSGWVLILFLMFPTRGFSTDLSSSSSATVESSASLLVAEAKRLNLAEDRVWHLLLHYHPYWSGGVMSEADGDGFFLAPEGKTDPAAELEATLRLFFSEDPLGHSQQTIQCAFPARYEWLETKLHFEGRLPRQNCSQLTEWLEGVDAEGVSLIFPSTYINNPASMFGHTLLRMDRKDQTPQTRLLDYAISYAANMTTDNPLFYTILGFTGGFRGDFSIMPYYVKLQEYRELENRDIWEYHLRLSRQQTQRLLKHAWELGNTHFDYFFLKENCAYHLLALLEIANPDLDLTSHHVNWVLPIDVVRQVNDISGLVADRTYVPSRSTKLQYEIQSINYKEQGWLKTLVAHPRTAKSAAFQSLPPKKQIVLLDLAADYLRYQIIRKRDEKEWVAKGRQKQYDLLRARQGISQPSEPPVIPTPIPPEKGHPSIRLSLGIGFEQEKTFSQLELRPSYHDLLELDQGYTPYSQVEAFRLTLRHIPEEQRLFLQQLTFMDVISLLPQSTLFEKPSWKFNFGVNTLLKKHCVACSYFRMGGSVGISSYISKQKGVLGYGFLDVDGGVGSPFSSGIRMGTGLSVGMLLPLRSQWMCQIEIRYLNYFNEASPEDWKIVFRQNISLATNQAFRLEGAVTSHAPEGQLRYLYYW